MVKVHTLSNMFMPSLKKVARNLIVTHEHGDPDAFVSALLLRMLKYHTTGIRHSILQVPTGKPASVYVGAAGVVDTGTSLDPDYDWYDHHQPLHLKNNSLGMVGIHSATSLVYEYWHDRVGFSKPLTSLIKAVNANDNGKRGYGASESFRYGCIGLVSALKRGRYDDSTIFNTLEPILYKLWQGREVDYFKEYPDLMNDHLSYIESLPSALEKAKVWESTNGKVIYILNGGSAVTRYALEHTEARVVLFHDTYTKATGIVRDSEDGLHVGDLVATVITTLEALPKTDTENEAIKAVLKELKSWWQHPQGFFCGTSAIAKSTHHPYADLTTVAAVLDEFIPNY